MKRIGVMAVHYGKEYLAWAAHHLNWVCDEVHVFYTPTPSFGFSEGAVCPDTEEELEAEASRFSPVSWHRLEGIHSEGEHRAAMLTFAQSIDATTMVIADADEVWSVDSLVEATCYVERADRAGRWLARFHNFWRSWQWTVKDAFRPVRIVDLRHPTDGTADAYLDEIAQPHPIYHFGYAQTLQTMRYKFTCHGHKAEFKPNWFERKFVPWTPSGDHSDLHPCVNNLWTAEPTDPETFGIVRCLMPEHPHASLSVIE